MSDDSQIETDSRTWRVVHAWAERQLMSSRLTLESIGYPPEQTEYLRGRIAAMKELLKLPEPKKIIPDGSTNYVE